MKASVQSVAYHRFLVPAKRHPPIVYWKFEDGPPDRVDPDPRDVGPAWIVFFSRDEQDVKNGEWITRAEAWQLARDKDYLINDEA